MTGATLSLVGSAGRKCSFDIYVAQGFVLTELAAIVDVLRVANRVCPAQPFAYRYRSLRGGTVESSSGASVRTDRIPAMPDADYFFALGNSDPDCPDLSLGRVIPDYTHRGARVFLLAEAASRHLCENGAPGGATHWENLGYLRERLFALDATAAIASENGPVVTCAGMGATVDVMLSVIGKHVSSAERLTVADVLLHERIRDFGSRQRSPAAGAGSTGDRQLDRCIAIMQANIEEPVPIGRIVDALGMSNRSLERRFKARLGMTPNAFYREIRLSKANNLLLNTTLSVQEIGLACGFPTAFSAVYRNVFGMTPNTMRRRRIAAQ